MISKLERIYEFLTTEKSKRTFAFIFYFLFIITLIELNLPVAIQIFINIILAIIYIVFLSNFFSTLLEKIPTDIKLLLKKSGKELKKIIKEIILFYIFLKVCSFLVGFLFVGTPDNQTRIITEFYSEPIYNSIIIIIIGPILEECIFRYLPSRFIKNKILYIVISSIIFAGMHVINYPNPLYYIWFYLPCALYFGYRYYKTKDLLVTISIHCFNNFISLLPFIISLL